MADEVLVETKGRVLVITLNRPDARNAINTGLAQGLTAALTQLEEDPALSVGILTGAGAGFCSGMDLKAFLSEGPPQGFQQVIERTGFTKPLICAIEGFAMAGGLELALTCDLIVAANNANLGIPEAGVGLFAAAGALLRLPRRVPYGVAMEMALTAEPIGAVEANRIGLVDKLAEPGSAVDEALALAERVAKNAPLALAASAYILRESQGRTEEEFWKFQGPQMGKVFFSEDAKEGPRSFAEKRAPNWQGK